MFAPFRKIALLYVVFALVTLLAGCSSSSSDSDGDGGGTDSDVLEGVFIDAAVEGLDYETDTQSGTTDADGTFTYEEGETVTFTIGDFEFGAAAGAEVLTPWDLAQTVDADNLLGFINRIAFLQALDDNDNVSNGIKIPDEVRELLQGQSIDFETDDDLATTMAGLLLDNPGELLTTAGNSALKRFVDSYQGASPDFDGFFDFPIVDIAPGLEGTGTCTLQGPDSAAATIGFTKAVDEDTLTGANVKIWDVTDPSAPVKLAEGDTAFQDNTSNSWGIYNAEATSERLFLVVLTTGVTFQDGSSLPAPFFWYFFGQEGCG